jgi:hypothetical protein
MHRNPVKRGLVSSPERWAWSSFRHYVSGVEGVEEIESQWTARKREECGVLAQMIEGQNPRPVAQNATRTGQPSLLLQALNPIAAAPLAPFSEMNNSHSRDRLLSFPMLSLPRIDPTGSKKNKNTGN